MNQSRLRKFLLILFSVQSISGLCVAKNSSIAKDVNSSKMGHDKVQYHHTQPVQIKNDRDEVILKTAKAAAAQTVVTESAKKGIDYAFTNTAVVDEAGQAAGEQSLSVGAKTVAVIGIVKSGVDLVNAKTDKERLYDSAGVAVGVVSIAFPPAGAVAGVCLAVVQVSDTILSIQSAAKIAELQAQIIRSYQDIYESKERILEGDLKLIKFYIQVSDNLNNAIKKTSQGNEKVCKQAETSRSIDDLQSCLQGSSEVVSIIELLSQTYRSLATVYFAASEAETVMKQYGLSKENLIRSADLLEIQAHEKREILKAVRNEFNKASSELILNQLEKNHQVSVIEDAMRDCRKSFDNFILKSSLIVDLLHAKSEQPQSKLLQTLKKLDIQALIQSGDDILNSGCDEITPQKIPQSLTAQIQAKEYFSGFELFKQSRQELLQSIPDDIQ